MDGRDSDDVKQEMAGKSASDHVILLAAYTGWKKAGSQQPPRGGSGGRRGFGRGAETGGGGGGGYSKTRARREFCDRHCLSKEGMNNMNELRKQLARAMVDIGFLSSEEAREVKSAGSGAEDMTVARMRIVRAVLCAGMYPNVVQVKVS